MKQTRQIIFVLLLSVTFYLTFFSEQPFFIRALAAAVYLIIVLSVCYVLILENRSPYKTLVWIYAILFFPVAGYIFFIYSGQLQVRGHLFDSKRRDNQRYLEPLIDKNTSSGWNQLNREEQFISNRIEEEAGFPINFSSEVSVLKDGDETFPAIKERLREAKDYIHMEYYTFRDDQIGQEIIDILKEKAELGLEVKVIFDAAGSIGMSGHAKRSMKKSGVEMACFHPIKSGFFTQKINFRNHRKIFVIDGDTAFVGGLNIGDEYLGRDPKIGFWRDTHLKVEGEAIRSLETIFMIDWSYLKDEVLDLDTYTPVQNTEELSTGGVQILSSGPDANRGMISELYFNMIANARHSVWIATPYFVPDKDIRTALSLAAKKGIDVKLMVPEISDGFLPKYATRSYFGKFLDKGIDIYQYEKGFMHQKIMIVDGQSASIGTANVDFRSLNLNFEVNAFLFRTSSVTSLIDNYKQDMEHSHKVDAKAYRNRGIVVRTKESFARLFSPAL
ncbi:cardiolipin synthase [Halobacillus alkaliphilus]|uniref:Cardiolipin synthase n=1 Tax=Halobacillus alkaliphilus TaxID=396056 RepID=A0A1I2KE47_9BACI|nr:cardiolipin synthase [Halobacillus alkaliphilus]SFF64480.1 cardiolipin synthase [Halobacillus alkaliphilus]